MKQFLSVILAALVLIIHFLLLNFIELKKEDHLVKI